MKEPNVTDVNVVDRRALLSGVAMLAGGMAAMPAHAAVAAGGVEAANLATARSFCAAWDMPGIDPARLVSIYFADDAIVRVMDSTSIARGRAAIVAMFAGWLEAGRHFRLEIAKEAALGPIVIHLRDDITLAPGAAPHVDHIASVFVMAGGRIKEWSDYVMA